MPTTLRLLTLGFLAATAATAFGQNSRYVGDLRTMDRELLSTAAVAPGYSPQGAAQASSVPAPNRGAVNPRDQRKRSSLFGMLSAWTRGSDKSESSPPAPKGAIARSEGTRHVAPSQNPSYTTRWTRKENQGALPLPIQRVDPSVTQAGAAGLPLPQGAPLAALAPPMVERPLAIASDAQQPTPRVIADPAVAALARVPDPPETSGLAEEPSFDDVVFVSDTPESETLAPEHSGAEAITLNPHVVSDHVAEAEATTEQEPMAQSFAVETVKEDANELAESQPVGAPAALVESAPASSAEEPTATVVALVATPEVTPAVVKLPELEEEVEASVPTENEPAMLAANEEPGTAPVSEGQASAAPEAIVKETVTAQTPAPVLNQPTLSPQASPEVVENETYNPHAETQALVVSDRSPARRQPRVGLPPRRPAPVAEPSDRAKMLLTEAHYLAQEAITAEEYTAIVQRCRYVLAFDKAPQAIEYAHELGAWALNCRGEVLMEEGRPEEAEADFLDALLTDVDCWRAEHNLGVISMRLGELDQARERFDRTLELNPEFAKAYSNRAALSVQSGDYEAAMQDYERAIEADPDLAVAHTGRGRLCHMLGYIQQALRHLDAAALITPDDAAIAIARGDLLVDFGRYGHARSAYERAIQLKPDSPIAYRNLAWLQATCPVDSFRDGEAALRNAERAADLSGEEDDIALDTYAAALAAAGRFEEAAETQLRAAEMAPEADSHAYLERLALYMQGESFTSQPIGGVVQVSYTK